MKGKRWSKKKGEYVDNMVSDVSKEGKEYQAKIAKFKMDYGIPLLTGDLSMTLECFPYAKNKRDIDNYFKCLNDSLQYAGIIENDNLIRWQLGKMQSPFRDWPCVLLRIEQMRFEPVSLEDRIAEIQKKGETIIGFSLAHKSVEAALQNRQKQLF